MELFKTLDSICTKKISFGCPILDRFFGGGIPIGSITEVAGESGSGKTQLMLQLVLNTQLPEALGGQSANSLFLNSELSFPIKRLHEIASNNPFFGDRPLDKVFVHSIQNVDELLTIVMSLESYLAKSNTKLIVVDSVATLFRTEFGINGPDMTRRQQIFFKIASKFKMYAYKYDLAIIFTNQVVDCIPGTSNVRIGNDPILTTSGRQVNPALGLSWANCINTRLMITKSINETIRTGDCGKFGSSMNSKISREMVVIFSPHIGRAACQLDINKYGVFGVTRP